MALVSEVNKDCVKKIGLCEENVLGKTCRGGPGAKMCKLLIMCKMAQKLDLCEEKILFSCCTIYDCQ